MKKAKPWRIVLAVLLVIGAVAYGTYYARFQQIPLTEAVKTEEWVKIRGGILHGQVSGYENVEEADMEAVKNLFSGYTVTRMGKKSTYSTPDITLRVYIEGRNDPMFLIVTDTGVIMYSDGEGNGSPCFQTKDTSVYDELLALLTA